ncbi:helix-turn-helix domain-containing protein [Sulfitobacter sp. MF3-043]|uniref:helix-turn-helix domain-containing protein n=1 Tax=Sulfitobacter sediminivivens TaxID=3252902 RepID=UPI0036DE020E
MAPNTQSPAQLRNMFGLNLRTLASSYDSISDLARQLGINRTQFNRYLSGESFPRPDVLSRICSFFGVDARVLLQPVDEIGSDQDPIANPFLRDFVGSGARDVPEELFPAGFYRFSRRSFVTEDLYIVGLVHVRRDASNTFLRGYETKTAMKLQFLPTHASAREFRGVVMQQEDGLSIFASRKHAMTSSFNYLSRVASFDNNFWVGYVTRTVPESVGGLRATRLVYEYLGTSMADVLPAARSAGFCTSDELLPYHRRLLRPGEVFT